MMVIRPAAERGHFDHGWLDTWHSFSFADYFDPAHMGFRALRVINEDRVSPSHGFGMHGHRDMEILTYVLSGRLAHRDSLGHGAELQAGEVQRITAGRGIQHSEVNPSTDEPVHLYQIWLKPREPGLTPSYEQRSFSAAERRDRWQCVASPDGRDGSVTIQQDATVWLADLTPAQPLDYAIASGRMTWLQVLRGEVEVSGRRLRPGDGLSTTQESALRLQATQPAEVMLFDLA